MSAESLTNLNVRSLKLSLVFILSFLMLSGCTSVNNKKDKALILPEKSTVSYYQQAGIKKLRQGDFYLAAEQFQAGLRLDPADCNLNTLNGLNYHIQGKGGDKKYLQLAEVGYQIVIRNCPHNAWAYYFYGTLLNQQGKFYEAKHQFHQAIKYAQNHQSKQLFLKGFIISSFNTGEKQTVEELLKLVKVDSSPLLRYVNNSYQYLAENTITQNTQITPAEKPVINEPIKQAAVDAVIILNRKTTSTSRGLNLLDGLMLQYGYGVTRNNFGMANWGEYNDNTSISGHQAGSFAQVPFSRLITQSITIPAINYSLNIFNNTTNNSEILSRPTLIVADGKKSSYFSGVNLILGIEASDSSTISSYPIGLSMDITPKFLSDDMVELEISLGRDSLNDAEETPTSFKQVVSSLSEKTNATVTANFGKTVILSALSDTIINNNNSKTPFIGNIPIVNTIFSKKSHNKTKTSVLVLLTLKKLSSLNVENKSSSHKIELDRILRNKIHPKTDLSNIIKDVSTITIFDKVNDKHGELYNHEVIDLYTSELKDHENNFNKFESKNKWKKSG